MSFTHDSIPDQAGRVAIVTGANSGIGFETAKSLAAKGATVVLACRNLEKAEAAKAQMSGDVRVMQLDLGDLASVDAFASAFSEGFDRLDLLINNAGVMMPPYGKTKDGFELQIGTNHLGHFALTAKLLPLMEGRDDARVVNVASLAHKGGKIRFDDLHFERGYSKMSSYGQSKLANLLFTYELDRRLKAKGSTVRSTAAHPGWTNTNLQRHSGWIERLNPIMAMPPVEGCLPTLMAAIAPTVEGGDYYGPAGFMEASGPPKRVKSNKRSHDRAVAERLWDVSESLTETPFAV